MLRYDLNMTTHPTSHMRHLSDNSSLTPALFTPVYTSRLDLTSPSLRSSAHKWRCIIKAYIKRRFAHFDYHFVAV